MKYLKKSLQSLSLLEVLMAKGMESWRIQPVFIGELLFTMRSAGCLTKVGLVACLKLFSKFGSIDPLRYVFSLLESGGY